MPVRGIGLRLYALTTYIEPDGRVKGHVLTNQQVDQFVVEGGSIFGGAEVSVFHAPIANGFGYTGYQLAHSGLALIGANLSVEVFRRNYISRGHRPIFGNFDIFLLEDHVSLGVRTLGMAKFPLDLGVGGNARLGEKTAEAEARSLRLLSGRGGLSFNLIAHFWHFLAP